MLNHDFYAGFRRFSHNEFSLFFLWWILIDSAHEKKRSAMQTALEIEIQMNLCDARYVYVYVFAATTSLLRYINPHTQSLRRCIIFRTPDRASDIKMLHGNYNCVLRNMPMRVSVCACGRKSAQRMLLRSLRCGAAAGFFSVTHFFVGTSHRAAARSR